MITTGLGVVLSKKKILGTIMGHYCLLARPLYYLPMVTGIDRCTAAPHDKIRHRDRSPPVKPFETLTLTPKRNLLILSRAM